MAWEVSVIEWLQQNIGGAGKAAAKLFSVIGGETFTLVLLLVILFCYKKEAGKRGALSIILASMWFPMAKNIALRLRPYMEHAAIEPLIPPEADAALNDVAQQGYSFPSGHAAMSLSIYGSLCLAVRKKWLWIAGTVIVLLIGISRFAVGVHYPTDVLAGWAVGLAAICFGELLCRKVKREWLRYAIILAMTIPGVFWCTSRDYYSALGVLAGMTVAFPYEEKHIGFRDTRNVWAMILRVAGAMAIYLGLNTLLKLPFSKEYLNSGMTVPNLIRAARYAVILFVLIGVYPRLFPLFEKVGGKKSAGEGS